MQRAAYERLNRELNFLLDYNPPALPTSSDSGCPPLIPLSFYDKHLDERLILRKVTTISSLAIDISEPVNRAFKSIKDHKLPLPLIRPGDAFSTVESVRYYSEKSPVIDAQFVARAYGERTARFSRTIASMFSLHLHAPRWSTILSWKRHPAARWQPYYALTEEFTLELDIDDAPSSTIPEVVLESMDRPFREDLKEVKQRFPMLALWQIFSASVEVEEAIKDIDTLSSIYVFPYSTCRVLGSQRIDTKLPYSPDALTTSWGISTSSFTAGSSFSKQPTSITGTREQETLSLRRSSRVLDKSYTKERESIKKTIKSTPNSDALPLKLSSKQVREWPSVTIPSRETSTAASSQKSVASSLIQHAWVRAVQRDSTFIILHCGNFERIGFRHRASQTLYVSDVIDVTHCKDPAYGQIHIGLYMSIIEDVLDRTRQQVEHEKHDKINAPSKRRRSTLASSESSKRPRTRALVMKEAAREIEQRENYKIVVKETASRSLVLMQLHYERFNSPAPAAFLRVSESTTHVTGTYTPHEYLLLTLTSEIAVGATGDVHAATLEILAANGKTLHADVVVKLAFEPDQQKRMRHEFSVYQHLILSKVKRIPDVLGLFHDVENDALALIMNHVGTCVWDRRTDKDSIEFTVSESERAGFIDAMKEIHRAGVRHRDIRPENMVVNDDGTVTIIDFDQADIEASEGSREREFEHLLALLDGDYTPPGDLPSLRTPDGRCHSSASPASD